MLLLFFLFSLFKHATEKGMYCTTGYFAYLFTFSWKHSRAVRCRVVKRCRVVTPFWSCTGWGGRAFYSWAYCFSHSRRAFSIASLELWRRALSEETFKKVSRLKCSVFKKGWGGGVWQNAEELLCARELPESVPWILIVPLQCQRFLPLDDPRAVIATISSHQSEGNADFLFSW